MLSKRLQAIADCVGTFETMADVGTDHAYLPVELILRGQIQRAIASDVNRGPLALGRARVEARGLSERIALRLGSGLSVLHPGEAEAIVIAGMGGRLIRDILADDLETARSAKLLVLQPQRDGIELRNFLYQNGFQTRDEKFLEEDGKFYEIIRTHATGKQEAADTGFISRYLLNHPNQDLLNFIRQKRRENDEVLAALQGKVTETAVERRHQCEWIAEYYQEVERHAISKMSSSDEADRRACAKKVGAGLG